MEENALSRWQQLDAVTKKERQEKRQASKALEVEKWRQYRKTYYETHKDKYAALRKKNKKEHPERYKAYRRKSYPNTRARIFAILGAECCQCGFADIRALCIDHINGGGTQERKQFGDPLKYYRHILKMKGKGYQVLCANCNLIKRIEQRENGLEITLDCVAGTP